MLRILRDGKEDWKIRVATTQKKSLCPAYAAVLPTSPVYVENLLVLRWFLVSAE